MARAFTAADVVQTKTLGISAAIDAGVSLDAPTVEGRSGVLMLATSSDFAAPEQWDTPATSGTVLAAPQTGVACRACTLSGEQTWAIQSSSGANVNWAWVCEEWTNLSYAPVLTTARNNGVLAPTSVTIGPTGAWDAAEYALGIAVVSLITSVGGAAWPTVSWSDSFTQTDTPESAAGTTSAAVKLYVARRYGTAGETGPWSTTATFTGDTTNKTAYSAMVVFRAEKYVGEA